MDIKNAISKKFQILFILFVLLVIFIFILASIGVPGPGILKLLPCQQYSSSGFNCTDPIMYTNGTISFLFSQGTGATLYNVHFACALFTNNYNAHPVANADQYYDLPNISSGLRNDSLANKERISITNLQCYGPNGSRLNSRPSSVPYGGYVLINYTTNDNTPSANNPWISSIVTQI